MFISRLLSKKSTSFGQAKMFKQVKNLKKEFQQATIYKKENHHRSGRINDGRHKNLILGVGRNATGPLGQTKKQIVKGNAIKNAVTDLIKEIDPDVVVEDAKFRNSHSLVVLVTPAEKALKLNEIRGNIRVELEDFMGDKGISAIPSSITFTGMELGFRDLERTLQDYDLKMKQKAVEMDKNTDHNELMDFIDGFGDKPSVKDTLRENHAERIKHWEGVGRKSPLAPITGIDHVEYEAHIFKNYSKFRAMARYLDEHSVESAIGRFDRHPYEYEIENQKRKGIIDKREEFKYEIENKTREELKKEEENSEYVRYRPKPEDTAY